MIDTPYHIILASNSPRRKELLGGLDLEYEVRVVPGIEENYPDGLTPEQIPQYQACQKAQAYTLSAGEMLITADTVVVLGREVLGKPADEAEAKAMLAKLSGKTHTGSYHPDQTARLPRGDRGNLQAVYPAGNRLLCDYLSPPGQGRCLWHPRVDRFHRCHCAQRQFLQCDGAASTTHIRRDIQVLSIPQ